MRKHPGEQLGGVVGLVPRVVPHPFIFRVTDVPTCRFQSLNHLTGLRDGNRIISAAVENPHGSLPDLLGDGSVGVRGIIDVMDVSPMLAGGKADAATDWRQSSKPLGVLETKVPSAIATHRKPGEVDPLRVTLEFLYGLIQSFEGLGFHGGIRPPVFLSALRKHHDERKSVDVIADRGADALLGLDEPVIALLSMTMQEEYDRPLGILVPIARNKYLVIIGHAAFGDDAIQKSRFGVTRPRRSGGNDPAECDAHDDAPVPGNHLIPSLTAPPVPEAFRSLRDANYLRSRRRAR